MAPLLSKEGLGVVRCSTHHPDPSSIEEGSYFQCRLYAQKQWRTTARRRVRTGTQWVQRDARRCVGGRFAQPSSRLAEMRGRQAAPCQITRVYFSFFFDWFKTTRLSVTEKTSGTWLARMRMTVSSN